MIAKSTGGPSPQVSDVVPRPTMLVAVVGPNPLVPGVRPQLRCRLPLLVEFGIEHLVRVSYTQHLAQQFGYF